MKSKIWKLEEGEHVETNENYAMRAYKNSIGEEEYRHGEIKSIVNIPQINGSVVCFWDECTKKLITLNEIHLRKYDGISKRYVRGDLVTTTTIEDVLLK